MANIALITVDVQNALLDLKPYNQDVMITAIQTLLKLARQQQHEVIFLRHQSDNEPLQPNSQGWQISDLVKPLANEKIINKRFNSAFRQTSLKDYLDKKQIDTLIITGMQTEFCIESTVRVAFEYGYNVIVPSEANSTFDSGKWTAEQLHQHHNFDIIKDRFAKMLTVKEIESLL